MWLADLLRRFVVLYLKLLLSVAALLIFLGYLNLFWQSAKASPFALLILLVLSGLACIAAYFIREHGRPRSDRHLPRRGAERTPVLPQDRGETC